MNSKVSMILRILLGLILLVFGLNKFIHFIPMPASPEGSFMAVMFDSYLGPLLAVTEIVCGLLLVANKYVPLALTILLPVSLNILLFHVTMAPADGYVGYAVFALNLYLMFANKDKFSALLSAN